MLLDKGGGDLPVTLVRYVSYKSATEPRTSLNGARWPLSLPVVCNKLAGRAQVASGYLPLVIEKSYGIHPTQGVLKN